jgi:hypothetical protein
MGRPGAGDATGADAPPVTQVALHRPPSQALLLIGARLLAASVLLISAAILVLRLHSPFTISAMASTTTIVLHDSRAFRRQRILRGYLFGLLVSVPISLAGALLGLPGLAGASVSAAVIAAGGTGRRHPPTTCIPLAVTTATDAAEVLSRWCLFTATAGCWLATLWMLSLVHAPFSDNKRPSGDISEGGRAVTA